MKNLDLLRQQRAEFAAKMKEAVQNNNEEAFAEAFIEFANAVQEAVIAEAKGIVQASDAQILAGRGVRVLTSEEVKYYNKLVEAMKSGNPRQALESMDVVMPETIINQVFDDLTEQHPLLSRIRFENATYLMKWLYSTFETRFLAQWGPLTGEIEKELSSQFAYLQLEQTKLSAWVPISKPMLDLGPAWLDRYIRTILAEAIANGIEWGIINGRGVAGNIYEPIGMIRDLSQPIDPEDGYAEKEPVVVTEFTPEAYGELVAQLVESPNGLFRPVTQLILVVNPVDYYTKVMPATIYQRPDGTWARDILPVPTDIVQSAWVEQGTAILGLGRQYIMALGTGRDGRIEYSDHYQFLEDLRVYLIKLYGNGRPKDNNSFLVLDISDLQPTIPRVIVDNIQDFPVQDVPEA